VLHPWFREQQVQHARRAAASQSAAACRARCRTGVPPSERPAVWACALGMPPLPAGAPRAPAAGVTNSTGVGGLEWAGPYLPSQRDEDVLRVLCEGAARQPLLVDALACADVGEAAGGHHYFPFADILRWGNIEWVGRLLMVCAAWCLCACVWCTVCTLLPQRPGKLLQRYGHGQAGVDGDWRPPTQRQGAVDCPQPRRACQSSRARAAYAQVPGVDGMLAPAVLIGCKQQPSLSASEPPRWRWCLKIVDARAAIAHPLPTHTSGPILPADPGAPLRLSLVPELCPPCTPARLAYEARGGRMRPYPPSGLLPFRGLAALAAPLAFLYRHPAAAYRALLALYCRHWCGLHALSAARAPAAAMPVLCRTFCELLQVGRGRGASRLWQWRSGLGGSGCALRDPQVGAASRRQKRARRRAGLRGAAGLGVGACPCGGARSLPAAQPSEGGLPLFTPYSNPAALCPSSCPACL
jgi:hypothetical protein